MKTLDSVSTPTDLSTLFSKNFMRSFINQLSDSERYLNKIATKASRALITKSESSPWMVPIIFKNLISNYGTPSFDHITKTKTVDKVLCNSDETGLISVFDDIRAIIFDPVPLSSTEDDSADTTDSKHTDSKQADSRRQWAADTLLSAIRSGKTPKSENFLRRVTELLTTLGYFTVVDTSKSPKIPVSETSQTMFRTRLMSSLTHLIGLNSGQMQNGESWPYLAVRTIQNCRAEGESRFKSALEMDEKIEDVVERAMKTVGKLRKKVYFLCPGESVGCERGFAD